MTSLAKISLVVGLAALTSGGGWYQFRESHRRETEIADLRRQTDRERRQIQQLNAERDDLLARAREAPPVSARAFTTGDADFDTKMETVIGQVNQLRAWLKNNPKEKTPEFEFLQDSDWIDAVTNSKKFNVHSATRNLRYKAKVNLVELLRGAFRVTRPRTKDDYRTLWRNSLRFSSRLFPRPFCNVTKCAPRV